MKFIHSLTILTYLPLNWNSLDAHYPRWPSRKPIIIEWTRLYILDTPLMISTETHLCLNLFCLYEFLASLIFVIQLLYKSSECSAITVSLYRSVLIFQILFDVSRTYRVVSCLKCPAHIRLFNYCREHTQPFEVSLSLAIGAFVCLAPMRFESFYERYFQGLCDL